MNERPIIDFHTHLWWWPDHLSDEFVNEGMAAKRVKMAHSSDVLLPSEDMHVLDSTPESHRRDTAEADFSVVLGFQSRLLGIGIPNQVIAEYVRADPGRYIGFAGIEPTADTAVDDLHQAYDMGLRGVKMSPVYQGFDPTDHCIWAFYAEAERLDMPLLVHQGTTFARRAPLKWANPILLEEVAIAFPRLRIIIAHMGHPWETETVVVARKQPNVFADVSALHYRPWRFYNAMMTAHEYGVIPKLLLASDYPSAHIDQVIRGIRGVNDIVANTDLPQIPQEEIERIIFDNWRNFLHPDEWFPDTDKAPAARKG